MSDAGVEREQLVAEALPEGGWGYSPNDNNSGSPMSVWAVRLLDTAESMMGATVPAFARTEYNRYWQYARLTDPANCGGQAFFNQNPGFTDPVILSTAAGSIAGARWIGIRVTDPRVQESLGFLYRRWNDNQAGSCWYSGLGNSNAMYFLTAAMRAWQPNLTTVNDYGCGGVVGGTNSFDWYYAAASTGHEGLAVNLVRRQASDGSWTDTAVCPPTPPGIAASTGFDLVILMRDPAPPNITCPP